VVITFYVDKIANNFYVFFCVFMDTCFLVFVISIFFNESLEVFIFRSSDVLFNPSLLDKLYLPLPIYNSDVLVMSREN
jgi:hypothetical protein